MENLLINWKVLSKKAKETIEEETKEALKSNSAGSQMDIEQWNRVLDEKIEIDVTKEGNNKVFAFSKMDITL